jgi:hypothetical protein
VSGPGRAVDRLFEAIGRYWHAPMPPERVATVRILSGAFATIYVAVRLVYFASYAKLTPAQFKPIGVVTLLDSPLSPTGTWAIALVAVLSGVAFTVGAFYRVTGPLFGAALLWVFTYRSSWGMIFHTENLLCMHVLALGLAPGAADALSVDARRRDDGDSPEEQGRYGWPIRLVCGITVLAYVAAGVTKIRNSGIGWFSTDLLQNYVAYDAIRKIELGSTHSALGGYMAENHPWIFKPLAGMSLVIELGAPIAMVGPRFAKWWVVSIVAFHAGVLALMAILFPYPLFVIGFASFFPVEKLSARVIAWWRRRSESVSLPEGA